MNGSAEELKRVMEEWTAAEERGDIVSIASILVGDFVGIGPRGFMLPKKQWLERHESGKLRYESIRWDEVQVRLYADAAVITGHQSAEGKYEDYDLQDEFRATLIFVRQRGRWLLCSLHLSPIAGSPA